MTRAAMVAACLALAFLSQPGADAATELEAPSSLVLHGAFGAVDGGTAAEPASAYPGVPLDAYIRSAPLRLELRPPGDEPVDVRVEAAAGDRVVILSDGAMDFAGPDVPGESVVTATLSTASGHRLIGAWHLSVPDRAGGTSALFGIVPPSILLASDRDVTTGAAGNGCYAYLCSDIGMLGPIGSVPSLLADVGETLTVRTEDGSGLVGWSGRLHALPLTGEAPVAIDSGEAAEPASELPLSGLELERGAWLLELRVDFDRERGHLWHAYRLLVDPDDASG